MTIICNTILRIQYFSTLLKPVQIIMLPKPGKHPQQTAPYRPISLLHVFCKILEKILYDRLKSTIEEEKLMPDRQFGFRNKHSTTEQMHKLVNEILLAIKKKQYCTVLFMDIVKASGKVNHESLLQTIKNISQNKSTTYSNRI